MKRLIVTLVPCNPGLGYILVGLLDTIYMVCKRKLFGSPFLFQQYQIIV